MIITDTHTHLYAEQFDADRREVINNALKNDIKRFCIPSIDSSYTNAMFELENHFPNKMFLMMGLHPTSVKENVDKELEHVKNWLEKRKFYAIGEIGIDLYWDKTFLKQQQKAFKTQIQWAKKYNLPIAIHCRNSFDEIFEILEEEKDDALFGIFHCFTGDLNQAKQALSYNMKLGIGGVVTFKNGKIDQFLNEVPLHNIVLETDAPYLAPTPYRGKRNEPIYILKIIEKLSEIYNLSQLEIANITSQNAANVFKF